MTPPLPKFHVCPICSKKYKSWKKAREHADKLKHYGDYTQEYIRIEKLAEFKQSIAAQLEEILRTEGDQLKDYKIQQLIAEIRGKE